MQRHHGALTESNQAQCRGRKIATLELGVEKTLQNRRRFHAAEPALVLIAKGERKPLPADGSLAARLGCMRRYECSVRQQALPGTAKIDQVVPVRAVPVQKYDKCTRRSGARLDARSIEL